jgi:hypothetical protein
MKRQLEEEKCSLIKMEAKLAGKQRKVYNVKTHFQSLNAYTNLITLEKSKDLVKKLAKDFRDFEKKLGIQKFLVKRGCQIIDYFEKEHVHVSSRFKDVATQLEVLEFQILCNVLWAEGFTKTINLMSNGVGVTSTPLPMKNPKPMSIKTPSAIIIKAYPIC